MKVKHEWFVTGKDQYGEYTLNYSTRKEARYSKKAIKSRGAILKLEYVNITHRVYQLIKEEKVS